MTQKWFRPLFLGLLVSHLWFTPAPVWAEPQRSAQIENSAASVKLEFNDHMQSLMTTMGGWENKLKAAGIEATFYIGAGDLRRAILQMPADGPGDVEVFVHFKNREISPRHLGQVHQLLAQHGIDIRKTLNSTFGEEKKLDLFVKDSYTLRENKPYFGEFGFFEGMGDTSINQLIYSPTENRISGDAENIAALKQGKIRFTDQHKARKLEEAKKITRVGVETEYPETILRLALRSIRLKMDLLSAPNQNNLSLDPSFDTVLAGFELYFKNASPADIAKFQLNDKYLEQFVKIFRNRTNAELAKIKDTFVKDFPGTYKILGELGLNIDLLAKPRNARTNVAKLEFQAVHKNARFAPMAPLINPRTMAVANPFATAAQLKKILPVINPRARVPVYGTAVPKDVLALYSHDLAGKMDQFESLSIENKLAAVREYQAAVAFFSKPAGSRVFKELTFREDNFVNFPFVDPDLIQPDEKKTLLEFIQDGIAKARAARARKPQAPKADEFNEPLDTRIEDRIREAKAERKPAAVFVDLDGTLYNDATKMEYLLRHYDEINGTSFFKDVEASMLPSVSPDHFLFSYLSEQIPDYNELKERVEAIKEFLGGERFGAKAYQAAHFEPALKAKLLRWRSMGAKVIYVTARPGFQRGLTQSILERDGMPTDGLYLNEEKASTPTFKEKVLTEYRTANPNHVMTAFIDNDRGNVDRIRETHPDVIAVRVFSRSVPGMADRQFYMSENDRDIYKIWAGPIANCGRYFQNF